MLTEIATKPRHRQLSEAEMAANRAANRVVLACFEFDEMVAAECERELRNPSAFAAWQRAKAEG